MGEIELWLKVGKTAPAGEAEDNFADAVDSADWLPVRHGSSETPASDANTAEERGGVLDAMLRAASGVDAPMPDQEVCHMTNETVTMAPLVSAINERVLSEPRLSREFVEPERNDRTTDARSMTGMSTDLCVTMVWAREI